MSNRISTRLPKPLARLVASYVADGGCVVRAALARLAESPLTDAELVAAELPRGLAAISKKRRKSISRQGHVAKSQVSSTSDE